MIKLKYTSNSTVSLVFFNIYISLKQNHMVINWLRVRLLRSTKKYNEHETFTKSKSDDTQTEDNESIAVCTVIIMC